METIYIASPTVALLVSVGMQVLKNSRWVPWMDRSTGKLNAVLSGGVAFLTSMGIATTFDWNAETGQFAAGFSGNVWDILHLVAHFPVQWGEQHLFYKLLILPEILGEQRAIQRDTLTALQAWVPKRDT